MKSFLVLLVAALCSCAQANVTSTITQSYPLAAAGVVRLENINGAVEITGWDKNEVSLVAIKSAGDEEELARIEVVITATPDRLVIKTEHHKKSFFNFDWHGEVTYRLKVPAGVSLEKIAVVNATVRVDKVNGPMTLESVNGDIDATDVAASGQFKTVNGAMSVSYRQLRAADDISFRTVNGSCVVKVPAGAAFRIDGHTVNGGMECDFPVTIEESGRGKFKAHAGEGGPSISFHAVNGGLRIRTT
jgi:hypothetical protein